jgi:hypothetical protein
LGGGGVEEVNQKDNAIVKTVCSRARGRGVYGVRVDLYHDYWHVDIATTVDVAVLVHMMLQSAKVRTEQGEADAVLLFRDQLGGTTCCIVQDLLHHDAASGASTGHRQDAALVIRDSNLNEIKVLAVRGLQTCQANWMTKVTRGGRALYKGCVGPARLCKVVTAQVESTHGDMSAIVRSQLHYLISNSVLETCRKRKDS